MDFQSIVSIPVVAFCIIILFFAIGDIISVLTKAFVPSMLIYIILLLSSIWSGILPTDIIQKAGFSKELTDMVIVLIVVNMGSSLNLSDLKKEWKTVLIGIGGIIGVALTVLVFGTMIFGWQKAAIIAPPITGGFVAAYEMSQAALSQGRVDLSTIALLTLVLQSFPAYFLVPTLLKKEAKNEIEIYRKNKNVIKNQTVEKESKKLIKELPEKFNSSTVILAKLGIICAIAVILSKLSGVLFTSMNISFSISPTIFGLFLGVVGNEIGFLEKQALQKANSFGYILIASIVGLADGLIASNPAEIFSASLEILVFVIIGIIGIGVVTAIVGKLLGKSWYLSFAIGLNCLLGFPLNFILTTEAAKAISEDQEEFDYLMDKISPTMLVGGFTTVTIGSVIFAGIIKNFIF